MALAGAALLCAGCPVVGDISSPEWKMSGKIKADFAMDSDETGPADGDYVQYVIDDVNDGNFTMTSLETRLAANLEMGAVTGKVEGDFWQDFFHLRHAYVALDLGNDMRLLAGQTWDVFAPLNPSTLNYAVGWQVGNVGHRSPQFRFEYTPDMGPVSVKAAFSDPDDANISFPDILARVGFKLGDNMDLGASVVLGSTDRNDDDTEEDVLGVAVDVTARLSDKFVISGEWYVGKGLAEYQGNIGETAPNGSNSEISGTGMWVQAAIKPTDTVTVNAGWMFDTNDEDDLPAGGPNEREDNSCIFGNVIFHLNENTDVGIEISKWETEYQDGTDSDNVRIQGSVIVKF
jgi:hypothetical protein